MSSFHKEDLRKRVERRKEEEREEDRGGGLGRTSSE